MLGVRPYTLGLFDEDARQDAQASLIASLSSRVDAVYAAALLLPPAYRAPVVERATGLRAVFAALREPALSVEYKAAAARLESLPAEVTELEAMLKRASDAAYRGARTGVPVEMIVPAEPGASALGKTALGLGALGAIGLGIWASL